MRLALVFFISGLTGLVLTRCKTLPPQTEKIVATSESLDADIDASHATPEEKVGMKKKNADVREGAKKQGATINTQAAEIVRLAWYEEKFWQIVLALGGVAIGAGVVFWFKW